MRKALFATTFAAQAQAYDILKDCGAVPSLNNKVSLEDTQQNSKALYDCFMKAQADPNDRAVVVPRGHIFTSMPVDLYNLTDITLTIDGVLETSPFYKEWPTGDQNSKSNVLPFI